MPDLFMMSLQKSRVYSFPIKDEEKKVRNGPFLFLIEEEKKNKEKEYIICKHTDRAREKEFCFFNLPLKKKKGERQSDDIVEKSVRWKINL